MEKKWMDIEGSFEINVDEETFHNEFLKWVNSKGWQFAGVIIPSNENEKKENYK